MNLLCAWRVPDFLALFEHGSKPKSNKQRRYMAELVPAIPAGYPQGTARELAPSCWVCYGVNMGLMVIGEGGPFVGLGTQKRAKIWWRPGQDAKKAETDTHLQMCVLP